MNTIKYHLKYTKRKGYEISCCTAQKFKSVIHINNGIVSICDDFSKCGSLLYRSRSFQGVVTDQTRCRCRFWLAVQDLKRRPLQEVSSRAQEIWQEFLAEGAPSSINLDSHSYERTSQNLKDPGRYSYEDAQVHGPRYGFTCSLCVHTCVSAHSHKSEQTPDTNSVETPEPVNTDAAVASQSTRVQSFPCLFKYPAVLSVMSSFNLRCISCLLCHAALSGLYPR